MSGSGTLWLSDRRSGEPCRVDRNVRNCFIPFSQLGRQRLRNRPKSYCPLGRVEPVEGGGEVLGVHLHVEFDGGGVRVHLDDGERVASRSRYV